MRFQQEWQKTELRHESHPLLHFQYQFLSIFSMKANEVLKAFFSLSQVKWHVFMRCRGTPWLLDPQVSCARTPLCAMGCVAAKQSYFGTPELQEGGGFLAIPIEEGPETSKVLFGCCEHPGVIPVCQNQQYPHCIDFEI